MAFYCVTGRGQKNRESTTLEAINSLFLLAPCLSALVISVCEYFLISVNRSECLLFDESILNMREVLNLKWSRAPDKLACQGRRERLQQAAKPPSSACFASYAVAFFIAAKAAKNAQQMPGALAPPGFSGGIITRPPKVGDGTHRLPPLTS